MIAIISGTNRPHSQTRRVAKIYEALFQRAGAETNFIDLQLLPAEIFKPESYATRPPSFDAFNQPILNATGVFIVTPEYNGSFPGVLKYFIDMLKFPESFGRRPIAFCGVAAGMWGALRSIEQLEAILKYRNAFSFSERVFLPRITEQLTDDGNFKSDLVRQLVDSQVQNFIKFSESLNQALPPNR